METKLLLEGYKTITSPIKTEARPLPGWRQMQHWVGLSLEFKKLENKNKTNLVKQVERQGRN